MTCITCNQFSRDKYEGGNYGGAQNSGHAFHGQVSMGMPAQTVAVAMIVGGVIVAMGMDVHV